MNITPPNTNDELSDVKNNDDSQNKESDGLESKERMTDAGVNPKLNPHMEWIEEHRNAFCARIDPDNLDTVNYPMPNPPSSRRKKTALLEGAGPNRTFDPVVEAKKVFLLLEALSASCNQSISSNLIYAFQGRFSLCEIYPFKVENILEWKDDVFSGVDAFVPGVSELSPVAWCGVNTVYAVKTKIILDESLSIWGKLFVLCHEIAHQIIRIDDLKYSCDFPRFMSVIGRRRDADNGWSFNVRIELKSFSSTRASRQTEWDCNEFAWDLCYYIYKKENKFSLPKVDEQVWNDIPDIKNPVTWPDIFDDTK